jgi:hypothetical protein
MTEIAINVQQQSDGITADGRTRTVAGDREGALFGGTNEEKYRQWLAAGKVFSAQFGTPGGTATLEANATLTLTEPFFRMTVPSSHVLVPIRVLVNNIAVWDTADAMYLFSVDTNTYSSGGAAPDVDNFANPGSGDSALGTVSCTNIYDGDSALTESAQTNPRLMHVQTKLTGDLFSSFEYNILKGDPMHMIHGESSFYVVFENGGAEEVHYSVIWAELDKNTLVNS